MSMFRRPLGWFVLTLSFLALAVAAALAYIPAVIYPALWLAGWSFAEMALLYGTAGVAFT